MPAAAKAKAKPESRRDLAEELLNLLKRNALVYAREAELKAALKAEAEAAGERFGERFPGLGEVRVSPPQPKRCTGTSPELVIDVFLRLPKREHDKLLEKGLVVIAEQWKDAYYGRVTAEIF